MKISLHENVSDAGHIQKGRRQVFSFLRKYLHDYSMLFIYHDPFIFRLKLLDTTHSILPSKVLIKSPGSLNVQYLLFTHSVPHLLPLFPLTTHWGESSLALLLFLLHLWKLHSLGLLSIAKSNELLLLILFSIYLLIFFYSMIK